jgi:Tol biopolymer transport system component
MTDQNLTSSPKSRQGFRFHSLMIAALVVLLQACGANLNSPPPVTLSVKVTGAGTGTVVSDVGGINCLKTTGDCNATTQQSNIINLTATADPGYLFSGWLGACVGMDTCTIDLSSGSQTVQAVFTMMMYRSQRALNGGNAADTNSVYNLWISKTDGTGATPLTQLTTAGTDVDKVRWSIDGTQILYQSARDLSGSDSLASGSNQNIWVINYDGTGNKALTKMTAAGVSATDPIWSPDGTMIAYDSMLDPLGKLVAGKSSNIWVMKSDGTSPIPVTSAVGTGMDSTIPQWSPDSSALVFTSKISPTSLTVASPHGTTNIWSVSASGTSLSALTSLTIASVNAKTPVFSPDGSQVAYVSNAALDNSGGSNGSSNNIWSVSYDSSNNNALTSLTMASATQPEWSPDGTTISYESNGALDGSAGLNTNSASNVWVMSENGENPTALTSYTTTSVAVSGIQWSADGSLLSFGCTADLGGANALNSTAGTSNIWIMPSGGGTPTPVTNITAANANTTVAHFYY